MKPPVFEYRNPRTLEEALGLLDEHGSDASILAGGQSLIPLLNLRLARPELVVDINALTGLDDVRLGDSVRISALARIRRLERHEGIRAVSPALADAFGCIAHPQIRSRTTIGGNISHADPSSELPGVLAAMDGRVELTSLRGSRWVPWSDFFLTVFTTSREPDELLTAVEFPLDGHRHAFQEIARRPGDYPLAGVCSGVRIVDGRVDSARIAAIAVSDRPVRLTAGEQALVGADITDPGVRREAARAAASELDAADDAHGSADYRRGLVETLITRTLTTLTMQEVAA